MASAWPVRFFPEIDNEVPVDLHAAIHRIAVDLHHDPAFGADLGVELVVPSREKAGGDIEPFRDKGIGSQFEIRIKNNAFSMVSLTLKGHLALGSVNGNFFVWVIFRLLHQRPQQWLPMA